MGGGCTQSDLSRTTTWFVDGPSLDNNIYYFPPLPPSPPRTTPLTSARPGRAGQAGRVSAQSDVCLDDALARVTFGPCCVAVALLPPADQRTLIRLHGPLGRAGLGWAGLRLG